MRWVVLDEADLLLGGGFQRDVSSILTAMQSEDVRCKVELISEHLNISTDEFYAKPRLQRKQAVQGFKSSTTKLHPIYMYGYLFLGVNVRGEAKPLNQSEPCSDDNWANHMPPRSNESLLIRLFCHRLFFRGREFDIVQKRET